MCGPSVGMKTKPHLSCALRQRHRLHTNAHWPGPRGGQWWHCHRIQAYDLTFHKSVHSILRRKCLHLKLDAYCLEEKTILGLAIDFRVPSLCITFYVEHRAIVVSKKELFPFFVELSYSLYLSEGSQTLKRVIVQLTVSRELKYL